MNVGFALALAFGISVVAGLRTFTAPAATAWAAHLHWLNLSSSHLAFMGSAWAVAILSLGVAVESVGDQLPNTAARTAAPQLAGRIITGSLTGACLGIAGSAAAWLAVVMGAIGSLVGAFGGTAPEKDWCERCTRQTLRLPYLRIWSRLVWDFCWFRAFESC